MSDPLASPVKLLIFGKPSILADGVAHPLSGRSTTKALLMMLALSEETRLALTQGVGEGLVRTDYLKAQIAYDEQGREIESKTEKSKKLTTDQRRDNKFNIAKTERWVRQVLADLPVPPLVSKPGYLGWLVDSDGLEFLRAYEEQDWAKVIELYGDGFDPDWNALIEHFPILQEILADFTTKWRTAVARYVRGQVGLGQSVRLLPLLDGGLATDPADLELCALYMEVALTTRQYAEGLRVYQKLCEETGQTQHGKEIALLRDRLSSALRNRRTLELPCSPLPKLEGFVGRGDELEQLEELLRTSNRRLINILGMGGIGKTKLALRLAHGLQRDHQFVHGVAWAGLRDARSIQDFLSVLGAAVGLTYSGLEDSQRIGQLHSYLQHKNLLLVLDNFETVLPAKPVLLGLLNHCEQLRVVVTSQHSLYNPGQPEFKDFEWVFRLEGLSVGQAEQLFERTVQKHEPVFSLKAQPREWFQTVFGYCAGLPLALELLAGRVVEEGLEAVAEDLRAASLPANPGPKNSVEQAIQTASDSLPAELAQHWSSLAVFVGDFTPEAATAVVGSSAEDLQQLTRRSLLEQTSRGLFTLHPAIRAHLRGSLGAELPARLAEHYGGFAAQARANPSAVMGWVEQVANFKESWRWYARNTVPTEARLEQGIFAYRMDELELAKTLLLEAERATEVEAALQAESLICLAQIVCLYDLEESSRLLEMGLKRLSSLPQPMLEGEALYALGINYLDMNSSEARKVLHQSERILRQINDTRRLGRVLRALGRYYAMREDNLANALSYTEEARDLFEQQQDWVELGRTQNNLSIVLMRLKRPSEAKTALEQSLRLYENLGQAQFMSAEALTLANLAWIFDHLRESERAIQLHGEALERFELLGDMVNVLNALNNRAALYLEGQQPGLARLDLLDALEKLKTFKNEALACETLTYTARALLLFNQPDRSRELARFVYHCEASPPSIKQVAADVLQGRTADSSQLSLRFAVSKGHNYLSEV